MSGSKTSVLGTQDPLDPECQIFWEDASGLKKAVQSSKAPPPPPSQDPPYCLKPELALAPAPVEEAPNQGVRNEPNSLNLSTSLKRPAGPVKPGTKAPEPTFSESDV